MRAGIRLHTYVLVACRTFSNLCHALHHPVDLDLADAKCACGCRLHHPLRDRKTAPYRQLYSRFHNFLAEHATVLDLG